MAKTKTDWSSLVKKEDWLVVWISSAILLTVVLRLLTSLPRIGSWSSSVLTSIRVADLPFFALLCLGLLAITSIAIKASGAGLSGYVKGFPLLFFFAFVSLIISKQETVSYLGLEYVIWALLIGLTISNTVRTPKWLKPAIKSELFIKTGLVLLGAEILFPTILKGGLVGLVQASITVLTIWYFCYFLATKAGLTKSFASIMASGVSICGVSAAIAAGGAVKGDKKEVSYTVSMVLLTSVVMLVVQPFVARMLGLPSAVAGAWIGGTIDTTGAVVAAGALYTDVAMTIAAIVKLSQNVLIGVAAFILAVYWTMKVESKPEEKPKLIDVWYRFPKFIVGFMAISLIFSFVVSPALTESALDAMLNIEKGLRGWFFSLSFVCIGLETRFKDLLSVGGRRAALVYLSSQALNIIVVYVLAWLLFGGILFPSPL